jgi:voltage-gated potassium channel Kch
VTLTTVGYGDISPITTTGRFAGVIIMVMGIAVLGVLAGSLASFFRLQPDDEDGPSPDTVAPPLVADEIGRLAELRDDGVLSPAEFEARKARLLAT